MEIEGYTPDENLLHSLAVISMDDLSQENQGHLTYAIEQVALRVMAATMHSLASEGLSAQGLEKRIGELETAMSRHYTDGEEPDTARCMVLNMRWQGALCLKDRRG